MYKGNYDRALYFVVVVVWQIKLQILLSIRINWSCITKIHIYTDESERKTKYRFKRFFFLKKSGYLFVVSVRPFLH